MNSSILSTFLQKRTMPNAVGYNNNTNNPERVVNVCLVTDKIPTAATTTTIENTSAVNCQYMSLIHIMMRKIPKLSVLFMVAAPYTAAIATETLCLVCFAQKYKEAINSDALLPNGVTRNEI